MLFARGNAAVAESEVTLTNSYLERRLVVSNDVLRTESIFNKLADTTLTPTGGREFRLRISGTDKSDTRNPAPAARLCTKSK